MFHKLMLLKINIKRFALLISVPLRPNWDTLPFF